MATVTIGRSYFEALLRRAEFVGVPKRSPRFPSDFETQHTSHQDVDYRPNLFNNVTISKAEHDYLLRSEHQFNLLKIALFRGGLTNDTLATLLEDTSGATVGETTHHDYYTKGAFRQARTLPVGQHYTKHDDRPSGYGELASDRYLHSGGQSRVASHQTVSYGQPDSSVDSPSKEDEDVEHTDRASVHEQRTVFITNLAECTTHQDLASIIRGGRLLDIYLRNDRTATVSFVEGAVEFLTHAKRNDIYLHMKRLEFRWADRQFRVPGHVSNKIASGATRNLVVRGVAGKLTGAQIRDHLDHIHNLVVVDISFSDGDAYISTNSIHNALFARTCMMSRTAYKGLRVEYYPDDCAAPLPRPAMKRYTPTSTGAQRSKPITNVYSILDTGSDEASDSDDESYMTEGVCIDRHNWADAAVA